MRRQFCSLVLGASMLGLFGCPDRQPEPGMQSAGDQIAAAREAPRAAASEEMPRAAAGNQGVTPGETGPGVTAMDQSNESADVEVTRSIRQSIANNESLSMNARNVTVVSEDGVVTLRGPVDGELEKQAIVSIAMRTPGVTRVDDQLEVTRD